MSSVIGGVSDMGFGSCRRVLEEAKIGPEASFRILSLQ
jgi:hypothetical protein